MGLAKSWHDMYTWLHHCMYHRVQAAQINFKLFPGFFEFFELITGQAAIAD